MVGGIFSDTENSLDCINHYIFTKMEFYGINGKEKTLYKYYLNNRHQSVSINN
jgi:hypothetical protein